MDDEIYESKKRTFEIEQVRPDSVDPKRNIEVRMSIGNSTNVWVLTRDEFLDLSLKMMAHTV